MPQSPTPSPDNHYVPCLNKSRYATALPGTAENSWQTADLYGYSLKLLKLNRIIQFVYS